MRIRAAHMTSRLIAALALSLPAAAMSAPATAPGAHEIIIRSGEPLQLAPKQDKEWYEQGVWPLVGAVAALMLTNAVAVGAVYLQASRSFDAMLRQRRIDGLAASLSEFYNPLLALLDINRAIFTDTGPPSFPAEEIARDAAATVWRQTKRKILVNNAQIETILRTRTHLIQAPDSLDQYQRLLVHVAMYETFQTIETDLYAGFRFPADIRTHVETQRNAVLEAYNLLAGETI